MKIDIPYGLKFYVKDTYPKLANKRGGESFTPTIRDLKLYKLRIQLAVNNTLKVIEKTSIKYPITFN